MTTTPGLLRCYRKAVGDADGQDGRTGRPTGIAEGGTLSICDSARRMASEGVAAFASHHAKRGPDKLPGRKVIRSEIWLLMEFVGCLRDLTKKVLNVGDCAKVPVVQIGQFSVVVWSWKAGGPFGKVRQCALNLAYHVSVIVHGGSMFDRHLKNSLSFRAGRLPVIPATSIY